MNQYIIQTGVIPLHYAEWFVKTGIFFFSFARAGWIKVAKGVTVRCRDGSWDGAAAVR